MLDLGVWRSRRHASRRARTTETRHIQVSMNGVLSHAQYPVPYTYCQYYTLFFYGIKKAEKAFRSPLTTGRGVVGMV